MEPRKVYAEIPGDLKTELDVYCAKHNKKQKDVIAMALRQFLEAEKQAK